MGQIGGSLHDAELHLVHTREDLSGSSPDFLVVAIFLDAREYGSNVEVSIAWQAFISYESKVEQSTASMFVSNNSCKHYALVTLPLILPSAKVAEL